MSLRSYKLIDSIKLSKQREIARSFIHQNPGCTYLEIRKATKLKIERIYKNMKEAYADANATPSKGLSKRRKEEQRAQTIQFIKENPNCTIIEIRDTLRVNIPRLYGTITNAYTAAGVAYHARNVDPSVFIRAKNFEKDVAALLAQFGEIKRHIKTNAGIIDCLFEFQGKEFVVEIKDFRSNRNIHQSQIRQLIEYMRSIGCKRGLLICHKERFPKRNKRNLYIRNLSVNIISPEEISAIFGDVVQTSRVIN